jgi:hypothetical protein
MRYSRGIWTRGARSLTVLCVVLLLVPFGEHHGASAQAKTPRWDPPPRLILDLQRLGYKPQTYTTKTSNAAALRRLDPGVNPAAFETYLPHLGFVDNNTLALSWVIPEYAHPGEEHDWLAVPKGVRLHVALVDTATGALVREREFPSVFRKWFNDFVDTQSTLLPFGGGRFLIHADNRLTLFDNQFLEICHRDLPVEDTTEGSAGFIVAPGGYKKAGSDIWAARVAVGGRTLILQHMVGRRYFLEWLNPMDLTTTRTREMPTFVREASDRFITYGWFRSVLVVSEEGVTHQICSADTPCERGERWGILENDQLLIPRQWSFLVYSSDGEMLWSRKGRGRGNGLGDATCMHSLSGNRFVLHIESQGRGSFGEASLKSGNNFLVYDAGTRTLVFQANFPEIAEPKLSPDGTKVALLAGKVIAFYDLPAATAPNPAGLGRIASE